MATRNTFRSLRTLFIAVTLLTFFTTACKKSGSGGSDVDPRDQYVGTYEGGDKGYQSIITISTIPFTEYGAATIVVTKGANPKEIYIEAARQSFKVTAELNGTNFTVIDKSTNQIFIPFGNTTYTGSYKATGVFDVDQATGKKAIAINATTETLEQGTAVRKAETYTGLRN
ncbi:hypothetical protein [Spirosoma agri]|uniref:Uncharacterized protein n=1 Tax=Spirosoma agri TaxID=1987381 RepID=A0A6M0IF27_9BACT|nr:hypothetical protein [Spirosoma agri]NEU66886.1 hypothetical protein [Spirosoma agri]